MFFLTIPMDVDCFCTLWEMFISDVSMVSELNSVHNCGTHLRR